MSASPDVSKMVGIYKKLFLVLVIITCLGIGMAFLHMPVWLAIVLGLAIITVKTKVVVDAFKHLLVGRNLLILVFGMTAFFFAGLVLIPVLMHKGWITDTRDVGQELEMEAASGAPAAEGHHGH